MGIDPNDPNRQSAPIGDAVVIPNGAPPPADSPSPTPRDSATWQATAVPPFTAAVPTASPEVGSDSPLVTAADDDMENHMQLVSGYVEALKREFDLVERGAVDHGRAILAEMRVVAEDEYNAFIGDNPKAAALVGATKAASAK